MTFLARLFFASSLAALILLALPAAAHAAEPAETEVYRIGASDILLVIIHPGGTANPLESEITVAGDGTIDVVHAGRIKVLGLSTSDVREQIRRKLIGSGVYLQPQVSVNIKDYMSQGVNVAGAVTTQGRYFLKGPTTLLDVVSLAGGIDDEKAGSFVIVTRVGAGEPTKIARHDLFSSDIQKARAANIRVLAGDNINIPVKARFCINGAVQEPNCYTLEEGTTLQQAISLGGGLDPDVADRKNVTLRRANGATEMKIDLDQMETTGAPIPVLEPDDVIVVGSREKTRFCVLGPVEKPDCYEYEKGLTLDGAISKAGGLKADLADAKDVKIRRVSTGKLQEFQTSLEDPTETGARFRIEPDDQIVVGKAECLITVNGAVATPDAYPMTTGMTIVDAIAKAGGTYGQSQWGKLSDVTLIRSGSAAQVVNVKAIMSGKHQDVPLQCGDKIFVKNRAL